MILDRMHLTNFKRFKDAEIDFKNGITGIVGNNGTGKSSIVDAIFFALFGVSGGIASDFIVSSFAEGEKCEVGLHFTVGVEKFYITRTFRKGKTIHHDANLSCNEGNRASGVTQVEAEVRRILGMGPADFRNTIYAAQKDLLTLLDLTPGKRKEWFLRALGIDYLNTGSQRILKEQVDGQEKKINLLQGELAALSRQDPAELENTRISLVYLKEKIGKLQVEEKQQLEQQAGLAEDLRQFCLKANEQQRLADQHTSLINEVLDLENRITKISLDLSAVKDTTAERQQLEETVARIPEARKEIEEYRVKKAEIDRTTTELKAWSKIETNCTERLDKVVTPLASLNAVEKEREDLYAKVRIALGFSADADVGNAIAEYQNDLTEKIANYNAQARLIEEDRKKIQKNLDAIRALGHEGVCPTCLRRLGDHFEAVEREYQIRLSDCLVLSREIDKDLGEALDESNKVPALKTTLDRIKEISILLGYRELYERELDDSRSALTEASTHVFCLTKELNEVGYKEEDHLASRQRLVDLEAAQNRLMVLVNAAAAQAGLQAELSELKRQRLAKSAAAALVMEAIEAHPVDVAVGPRLEHEIQKLEVTLRTITQDLAHTLERERTATAKIAELESSAQRCAKVQSDIAEISADIEILKLTRTAIAEYVVYIMQVVRARIESEVSSIIAEITDGKYDQVLLDEDFNLLVRENDREYTVDRFSGGEQDDIAVALRIALSRYLAELHQVHESTLLIFDEIFGSQDEERRANLLTALRSQESRFPQILLISHIAEIQGEFANTLIVQGNGPVSTVQAGA